MEDLLAAKQRYLDTGNLVGLAQVDQVEAELFSKQGRYADSLELLQNADEQFGKIGLEVFQGSVALQRGRIELELSELTALEQAADTAQSSLNLFERKKNPALAGQLMNEANDLLVDIPSMKAIDTAFENFVKDSLDFGANPQVYHTN